MWGNFVLANDEIDLPPCEAEEGRRERESKQTMCHATIISFRSRVAVRTDLNKNVELARAVHSSPGDRRLT